MEKEVLIFGHKNPDTDSICSSLVKERLNRKLGKENCKAVRIGKVNKETKYVLDYLKLEEPELIESVEEGQEVVLVDHNEFNQSVEGIDKAKILEYLQQNKDIDCIIAGEIGIAKIVSDVVEENEFLADRTFVTFDKSETPLRKGMFYIIQNQFEMGKTAFDLLLRHTNANIPTQKVFLSTKFIQQ